MPKLSRQKYKIPDLEKAIIRFEKMCAAAEHCSYEIMTKLYNKGFNDSQSRRILKHLVDNKFVDDRRFAEAYVNDKMKFSKWGPRKIYLSLLQKRIDSSTLKELIQNIDFDAVEDKLTSLLCQKAETMSNAKTYEGRTKLFRYAISQGYDSSLASKVIRKLFCN